MVRGLPIAPFRLERSLLWHILEAHKITADERSGIHSDVDDDIRSATHQGLVKPRSLVYFMQHWLYSCCRRTPLSRAVSPNQVGQGFFIFGNAAGHCSPVAGCKLLVLAVVLRYFVCMLYFRQHACWLPASANGYVICTPLAPLPICRLSDSCVHTMQLVLETGVVAFCTRAPLRHGAQVGGSNIFRLVYPLPFFHKDCLLTT